MRRVASLRPYMRDGVPGLPVERQEEMLRAAGIDLTRACIDRLTRAQIKRWSNEALEQRAALLHPGPRRQETIAVAELRVLGWSLGDVARALVAASQCGAAVRVVEPPRTFSAASLAESDILEALATAEAGQRLAVKSQAMAAAIAAAAAMRERHREAKLEAARLDWARPPGEISAAAIAAKVGISTATLYRHLGHRADAQAQGAKGSSHG